MLLVNWDSTGSRNIRVDVDEFADSNPIGRRQGLDDKLVFSNSVIEQGFGSQIQLFQPPQQSDPMSKT